jgi:hypothetical protein
MPNVASRVQDIYKHTSSEPLRPEQFDDWYRDLSAVRGEQFLGRLQMALDRAYGARPYQAFVMGHSGSGKSTELTRLCDRVKGRFSALKLNASSELDPGAFEPFDVLLITLEEVITRTAKPKADGGANTRVSDAKLGRIREWLGQVEAVRTTETGVEATAEAGLGVKGDTLWATVLGLFGAIRGEARFASSRTRAVREYQLGHLSDLITLANEVFDEANAAMVKACGREWLIVWEDFDKPGFADEKVQDLFLKYGHLWTNLRCNLIATIPIGLGYSDSAARLPLPAERRFVVPDPAVFDRQHQRDQAGRAALLDLLGARVALTLFASGQAEAIVAGSGGNLRDLLSLVNRAADNALLRDPHVTSIQAADVVEAMGWLRGNYLLRLGESPYEEKPVPFAEKVARLLAIYHGAPESVVPDRTLYALLRTHAVQEFNHERWLGVHPLVVDILEDQGHFAGQTPAAGTRAPAP